MIVSWDFVGAIHFILISHGLGESAIFALITSKTRVVVVIMHCPLQGWFLRPVYFELLYFIDEIV